MSDISTAQNQDRQIERLGAQRRRYSDAKNVFTLQLILSVPVSLAWAVTAVAHPELRPYASAWGVVVSALDLWLLTRQKAMRDEAARIQELFDCDVLELPWNTIKAGKPPEPELVKKHADRYWPVQHKHPPLTDWYPPAVGDLPILVGRVICQRANCWWDAQQRRAYGSWILRIIVAACALVVGFGFFKALTVFALITGVFVPLAPAILFSVRQHREQYEAASRMEKLCEHATQLFNDACGRTARDTIVSRSRTVQDEIFESRRRSPTRVRLDFSSAPKRLRPADEPRRCRTRRSGQSPPRFMIHHASDITIPRQMAFTFGSS